MIMKKPPVPKPPVPLPLQPPLPPLFSVKKSRRVNKQREMHIPLPEFSKFPKENPPIKKQQRRKKKTPHKLHGLHEIHTTGFHHTLKRRFLKRISKLKSIPKLKSLPKHKPAEKTEKKKHAKKHLQIRKEIKDKIKDKIEAKITDKIKNAIKQGLLRRKLLQHVRAANIYLERNKIDKAKHQYSKALLFYFKLPLHEEGLYLNLKSLLKKIERKELQPHWKFHHHAHQLLNLKREHKDKSKESLEAIDNLKASLEAQPQIAIPVIQEKSKKSFFKRLFHHGEDNRGNDSGEEESRGETSRHEEEIKDEFDFEKIEPFDKMLLPVPAHPEKPVVNKIARKDITFEEKLEKIDNLPKHEMQRHEIYPVQKQIKVEKKYEKIHLSKEQKKAMRKISKLKSLKQKLKDELEMLNQ